MKVKTDYDKHKYITAGKIYEVDKDEQITDDSGDKIEIMTPNWSMTCAHLDNEGFWEECLIMETVKAKDAAVAAKNISRCDWVEGVAKLVAENKAQYDRSTDWNNERLINRDNVCNNIDMMPLINKWLDGAECCDCRDELSELIYNAAYDELKQMADDFEIGVV